MGRRPSVVSMLAHGLSHWLSIETDLGRRLVFNHSTMFFFLFTSENKHVIPWKIIVQ